jgi:hypothetical protein
VPQLQAKSAGRVTGKVTSKTGDGLLGAVVTIFRQDHEGGTISFTRSDKSGIYALANLMPGSYSLQVAREGYQPLVSANVKIEPGRTTTLNVVLQELLGFIAGEPDPRNWDLKTVIRSTSDRRLIFRDLPGQLPTRDPDAPFMRAGALSLTSSTGLGSENYAAYPASGQNGFVTNFAFVEPLSDHGRMILSGQLNTGYDSYWRVRNTYNYRPDSTRDFKLSVGYGRLNMGGSGISSMDRPSQFFAQDPDLRESGLQTLGVGFEARDKILDVLALEYGFDLSQVSYGVSRTFFSPYLQVVVNPADSWFVRGALASRRVSDDNSVVLPEGEVLNLVESTYIAKIDGDINISQFKHTEFAVGKELQDDTTLELAAYEDRMVGPGLPFLVTATAPTLQSQQLLQLRQDQTRQRGLRLAMNRKILDFLNGSIAYVYGSGTSLASTDPSLSSAVLAQSLLNYMQHAYYHSVMGQLSATFPRTHTQLAAIVRWYPENPLTPIDLFADRADMLTKGVNFSIRQPIPLPEFMGSPGRWEALVDVRNMFDNGQQVVPARDGQLVLSRNPRSLRFGINLNLY